MPYPYEAGDTLTDVEAYALNVLKEQQAEDEIDRRGISALERDTFKADYLAQIDILPPKRVKKMSTRERAAKAILLEWVKEAYKSRGLTITGNLPAINSLVQKAIDTEDTRWKKALAQAEAEEQIRVKN